MSHNNDDNDSSSLDDSDSDDFLMSSVTTATATGRNPTSSSSGGTHMMTTLHTDGSTTTTTNTTDREALVRKKLLENFYGKSAVVVKAPDGVNDDDDDPIAARNRNSGSRKNGHNHSQMNQNQSDDDNQNVDHIDSKAFDIPKFVTHHIQSSSVQTLLEVEEQLSLQVRTYDSTMQTLVYENYTKFIDVTNAIKSIGTTVTTTNEAHIQQLMTHTNAMYHTSKRMIMDDVGDIGTIRQQVVEKKRIQRLLQRLHALFVLPQTIRQCIQQQQYTSAIAKYQHASMILAKYNQNNNTTTNTTNTTNTNTNQNDSNVSITTKLESFSSITTECLMLLQQLYKQLQHQCYDWSGRSLEWGTSSHGDNTMITNNTENDNDDMKTLPPDDLNGHKDVTQELPKSMTEIFESVRALSMLHQLFQAGSTTRTGDPSDDDDDDMNHHRRHTLVEEELYSMSFSAATRLLDRLLDAHSIQVQEYKFTKMNHIINHTTTQALDEYNDPSSSSHNHSTGSWMGRIPEQQATTLYETIIITTPMNDWIPQNILVAILECAMLYQNSFNTTTPDHTTNQDSSERNYDLMEFITEAYTTFMTHVRSILLQEDSSGIGGGGGGSIPNHENDDTVLESDPGTQQSYDISPEDTSKALTVLVQYVELFTHRLVDEVHLNVDYTNQLMRQAIDLASSLVHRRVDNQFRLLRYSIVNDCLIPFTNRIVVERERIIQENRSSSGSDASIVNQVLPEIIQMASSALSDCLQLVDDTIRSIFAETTPSTTENIDDSSNNGGMVPSDVQDAVQASTYRLVSWLANTFEIIVGGDSTDYNHIAQARKPSQDEQQIGNEVPVQASNKATAYENIGDGCEDELLMLLYTARENICEACDGTIPSDIILSIIELCRLSETMVPQQIEQSLHFGGGKKKSISSQRDLFPSSQDGSKTISAPSITRSSSNVQFSQRFQVAGSRIFTILIMNTAFEATYRLLSLTNSESDGRRPSDNVLAVVQNAKTLSLHCATLFGGTKRAGPVPIWDETIFNSSTMTSSVGINRKSGLYLDVERMFKEKVTIYPHPSDILEYSRDTALFLYFKIVLRSWYENLREYASTTFSSDEYQQIQMDTIFIKYIIPHYLSSDYYDRNHSGTNGRTALSTLLNDVLEVVEDRHHQHQNTDSNTYGRNNEQDEIQRKARNMVRSFMVSVESDATVAQSFIIKES